MLKQLVTFALVTSACGFAEVSNPHSILTTCPANARQARCVLQEFQATEPRPVKANAVVTATPGPFQQEFDLKIWDGGNAVVGRIDIPEGMQLVVESVSTYATVPSGQMPRISLSTTVRGSDGTYFVPVMKQETVDRTDWLCSTQPMKVYHDGNSLLVLITRTQSIGDANFSISVSGTLTRVGE